MNKTYISSLLVVLLAGAQTIRAQGSELDALMAEDSFAGLETEQMAPAAIESEQPAMMEDEELNEVAPVDTEMEQAEGLYQQGIKLYRAGDFDAARACFESLLAQDPYDRQAMRYLSKIAVKISARGTRKQNTVRAVAMADVDNKWAPEYRDLSGKSNNTQALDPKGDAGAKAMTEHLKSLMIPTLDFRDANIKDVVLFLTETCRRMDSSGKGVNMILLGLSGSDSMGAAEGNNITISIRDMSLYDALQVITEMASLKFDVESNMVTIMPVDYVRPVDLEMLTFKVIPEVGGELSSMAGGEDSEDTMEDLFGGGGGSSMSSDSGPVDVKGYFSIVNWPQSSSAIYYPSFNKLIVKNTVDSLKKVEAILDDLETEAINNRSAQVEIEAKFVEFSEGALSELGFNWNVYGNGSIGGFNMGSQSGTTDTYTPVMGWASQGSVELAGGEDMYTLRGNGVQLVEGGQSLFGGNQRSNMSVYESVTSGLLANMGGTPAAMMFTDGNVDLRISAMEQNGSADVLSAPKVTTQSGSPATIRVTEVHRYPQDWRVDTGQRTAPVVTPEEWEPYDLGVVLHVTPEVDTENNTIKLELNPEIQKFLGFDQYKVADNAYDSGGSEIAITSGDGASLYARMPYFELRSVETIVTVADGSTVMMGGLVDERTETFRDQVPIIGDIPYLGRLFRTEGTRNSKKNLVIFVKATQVDEMGMTRADRAMLRGRQ